MKQIQRGAENLQEYERQKKKFLGSLEYYCDRQRHLICKPYSFANLHMMAEDLGIKRYWFHKDHYDIPKKRLEEIQKKCHNVSSKEIVRIIRNGSLERTR
jgi:hypothetical protein